MIPPFPGSRVIRLWIVLTLGAMIDLAWAGVPQPDLEGIEAALAEQIVEARQLIEDSRQGGMTVHASALGELGLLYHALEYDQEALTVYRQAQRVDPFDGRWPYLIGMVMADQGESDSARLHFMAAMALMPSQTTAAWVRIARVLLDAGESEQALQAADRALARDEASPAAWAVKGEALLALEQAEAARDALQRALALEPRANRLHFPLAMALRALGDREAMQQALDQAGQIGVLPDDPVGRYLERHARGSRILSLRGRKAFNAGDLTSALALFQGATDLDPEAPGLWINLGVTQSRLGETDQAIESLQQAVQLDPEQTSARINLASLVSRNGDLETALDILSADAARLNRPEDLVFRARVARDLNRFDIAASDYLAALDQRKDLTIWQEAIEVLLALDRHEEVITLATDSRLNAAGRAQVMALVDTLLDQSDSAPSMLALATRLSDHLFAIDDSLEHAALVARTRRAGEGGCRNGLQWLMSLAQREDWPEQKRMDARALALALARQPGCQANP